MKIFFKNKIQTKNFNLLFVKNEKQQYRHRDEKNYLRKYLFCLSLKSPFSPEYF